MFFYILDIALYFWEKLISDRENFRLPFHLLFLRDEVEDLSNYHFFIIIIVWETVLELAEWFKYGFEEANYFCPLLDQIPTHYLLNAEEENTKCVSLNKPFNLLISLEIL